MATPASVVAALRSMLSARFDALATQRIGRDWTPGVGQTWARVTGNVVAVDSTVDANRAFVILEVEVEVAHRLTDPTDQATYLEGALLSDQAVLLAATPFEALAGVHSVEAGPELDAPAVLVGDVVTYTFGARLRVAPD